MPDLTRTVSEIEKAYAQYRPENRGYEPGGVVADVLFLLGEVERLQNKWISVDDRLPEPGIIVLIAIENRIYSGYFFKLAVRVVFKSGEYDFKDPQDDCTWGGNITHWQPLPEPPEVTK